MSKKYVEYNGRQTEDHVFLKAPAGGKIKIARGPQRLSKPLLQVFLFATLLVSVLFVKVIFADSAVSILPSYDGRICINENITYVQPESYICVKVNLSSINSWCVSRDVTIELVDEDETNNMAYSCNNFTKEVLTTPFQINTQFKTIRSEKVYVIYHDNITNKTYNTSFYVDTLPPEVILYGPNANEIIRNNTVQYAVQVRDDFVVKDCNVSLQDGEGNKYFEKEYYFANSNLVWINDSIENLKDGEYLFKIRCEDTAKNNATITSGFFVDANPPIIVFYPNVENKTVRFEDLNSLVISVEDNALDTTISNITCDYIINENSEKEVIITSMLNNKYNITIQNSYFKRGINNVSVWCTDWYFNTTKTIKFWIDVDAPLINVSIPNNHTFYERQNNLTFNITAIDDISKMMRCDIVSWYTNDSGVDIAYNHSIYVYNNTPAIVEMNLSNIKSTTTYLNISCKDGAGRENKRIINVKIDREAPSIELYPDQHYAGFNYYVVRGLFNPYLMFNISDDATENIMCDYRIDKSDLIIKKLIINSTLIINLSSASEGNHTVEICCNDTNKKYCYGEEVGKKLMVYIDKTPPSKPTLSTKLNVLYKKTSGEFYYLNGSIMGGISWISNDADISMFKVVLSSTENFAISHSFLTYTNQLRLDDFDETKHHTLYELLTNNSKLYIKIIAIDRANNTSPPEEEEIKAYTISKYPNNTIWCKKTAEMGGVCYITINNKTYYSGFDYLLIWNRTNNIHVNEKIGRDAKIVIGGYENEYIPSKIISGDKNSLINISAEDNVAYQLKDNENLTIKFEDYDIYGASVCVVGHTTNNSTLYIIDENSQPQTIVPQNAPYNLYCLRQNHTRYVTLMCKYGTSNCYLDKVFVVSELAFFGNVTNVTFDDYGVHKNTLISFNESEWVQNKINTVEIQDEKFSTIPVYAIYLPETRRQDESKTSRVGGELYSKFEIKLINNASNTFTNIIVDYNNCTNLFGDNAVCKTKIIEVLSPNTTKKEMIEVVLKNGIVADYDFNNKVLINDTIEVNKQASIWVYVTLKNRDTISYSNVSFDPYYSGWHGDEINLTFAPLESKSLKVKLKKVLIEERSTEIKDEKIKGRLYLRKIINTLFVKENLTSIKPKEIIYKIPLTTIPGFNKEEYKIVIDDNIPLKSTLSSADITIMLPSNLSVGEHKIIVEYLIKKEKQKESSSSSFVSPEEKEEKTDKIDTNDEKNDERKARREKENVGDFIQTKEYRVEYTTPGDVVSLLIPIPNINKTLFDVNIYAENVPVGWTVVLEKTHIPFIKPGTKIEIPVKISYKSRGKIKGVYSIDIVLTGTDETGRNVKILNKIIVDATNAKRSKITNISGRVIEKGKYYAGKGLMIIVAIVLLIVLKKIVSKRSLKFNRVTLFKGFKQRI